MNNDSNDTVHNNNTGLSSDKQDMGVGISCNEETISENWVSIAIKNGIVPGVGGYIDGPKLWNQFISATSNSRTTVS